MRLLALGFLIPFSLMGPTLSVAATCPTVKHQGSTETSQPPNLGELKAQILEYKCFGSMSVDVEKVLTSAKNYVEERAKEVKNPAIVLDVDETSLSNWDEILENDFGYISDGPCDLMSNRACGFKEWELSARATAIGPTLDLYVAAKASNVAVFFITGRREDPKERTATETNLRKVGYSDWAAILMRPPGTDASVSAFKTISRANIEAQGFTIIANVGDQLSDLSGGYSERVFRVPNPFYLIP